MASETIAPSRVEEWTGGVRSEAEGAQHRGSSQDGFLLGASFLVRNTGAYPLNEGDKIRLGTKVKDDTIAQVKRSNFSTNFTSIVEKNSGNFLRENWISAI